MKQDDQADVVGALSTGAIRDASKAPRPERQNSDQFRNDVKKLPKEIRNIIAGGLAGIVSKTVVAPVDRIKILYQISSAEFRISSVPGVARNIVEKEGFTALWKGNTATLLRVFPYAGIQFMVFERCKTFLLHSHQKDYESKKAVDPTYKRPTWGLTPWESLTAGMAAGVASVITTYPLDLTRAQLAVLRRKKHHKNRGFLGILNDNYTKRGFGGLFRGIVPTLMGILPYSGIAFALNEQGKRQIHAMTGRDVTTIERMQCGGLAGLVAQTITYPLEVTRRRMQTIGIVATSGSDAALAAIKGSSASDAARSALSDRPPSLGAIVVDLYKEQGIRGFFKGVSMNWVKGPVAFSISFTTFDLIQGFIETEAEREFRLPRRRTTRVVVPEKKES